MCKVKRKIGTGKIGSLVFLNVTQRLIIFLSVIQRIIIFLSVTKRALFFLSVSQRAIEFSFQKHYSAIASIS